MSYYNEHNPPVEDTRPITTRDLVGETQPSLSPIRQRRATGCSQPFLILAVVLAAYFFAPFNATLLILGIDRSPEGTAIGRSDTIILTEVQPLTGSVEMLSIPRDLWVPIPGHGESRINAAHAFGEAAQTGSGPQLALQTVRENFGVNVGHYLRIRLEGFASVIDSLGGIQINLPTATGAYSAGTYEMNGEEALAFVRDRTGDDFFRMQHGQIFIVAMGKKMLNPLSWVRIPGAMIALVQAMDTNVPVWDFPRIGFAVLRAVIFSGFDTRSIPREATTSWVTDNGAQVLLPNWDLIRPLMREMFGLF
jgi:polyisoprenyl-teichoic acid--peptidoglycan teichoic acid transferase